jgi:hypothetical protein
MPYRHPSTPKHNQGPKLERHWIRQSLSSAVRYIQDAADAWRTEDMLKTRQKTLLLHSTAWTTAV